MSKGLIKEVRRFQKIAGLLREGDIDLSNTPEFEGKPRTVKEYFNNKKFEDFIVWLVDIVVRDFANGRGWWGLSKSVEEYLESIMSLEDMEEFWEEYREGEGAREDLDEVEGNDIDLSDTPEFANEKKQFYVYDLEGIDEPMGPYPLEMARKVVKDLSASGIDYGMVDGVTAREIWGLQEDIDLSDTPEFGKDPDLWDEAFRDFVWDRIEGHYEELYGAIDPDDISDIIGQYLTNLPHDEVKTLWSDYMRDKRAGMLENDIDLSNTPEYE